MKDSEFLELLNLYLDHEISAAEAARLESELARNPERRKIYREYCRMQNACKVLAERQAVEVGRAEAGNVVGFESARNPRSDRRWWYLAGCAAAAACFAAIMLGWRQTEPDQGRMAARSPVASRATPTVPWSMVPASKPSPARGQAVSLTQLRIDSVQPEGSLVGVPLVLSAGPQSRGLRAAAPSAGDEDQLAWVRNFQVVSLQQPTAPQQLRFEARPVSMRPEDRQIGPNTPRETAVEMTSFRFVK